MFLAIDIGNTHTVLGVYRKTKLIAHWRIASTAAVNENELASLNRSFFTKEKIDIASIDGIGISSVVPALTEPYTEMCLLLFHCTPLIISAELNLGIRIHYAHPHTLGADRICNAVAGFAAYRNSLIIIDFGTATTYDVIAKNGDFLGGVIAPGIGTMASALHQRTAKLPTIALELPPTVIGTTTMEGMQSGILVSAIDAAEGMIKRIQKELHKRKQPNALVLATGGYSEFLCRHSSMIAYRRPHLVLEGIRFIYERVQKTSKQKR